MKLQFAFLFMALFFKCASGQAGIINGDFSVVGTPFDSWTTEDAIFDRPSDGGGFAVFDETGLLGSSQLSQTFELPTGAVSLSFDYKVIFLANGSPLTSPPDSFQVTLFDSLGVELFPSDPPLFTAFVSADQFGEYFSSTFVSRQLLADGFTRVTLNVSSLSPQSLTLDFLLNGANDGFDSSVEVDNVRLNSLTTVPEPLSLIVWGGLMFCARRPRSSARK